MSAVVSGEKEKHGDEATAPRAPRVLDLPGVPEGAVCGPDGCELPPLGD